MGVSVKMENDTISLMNNEEQMFIQPFADFEKSPRQFVDHIVALDAPEYQKLHILNFLGFRS